MMPFTNTALLSPRAISDAAVILQWAKDYISQPHPDLGRDGPVCPFVPPSIEKDVFYLAMHYETDGTNIDNIREVLIHYSDYFVQQFPQHEPENIYKTILTVFPNIPKERGTVLDDLHRDVKNSFVRKGLMLGQFHQHCPEPAARNPFFKISISPIPLVAIRNMSIHDILFLDACPEWFGEYDKRFGCKYSAGKITSATYKQAYYRAKEIYPTAA